MEGNGLSNGPVPLTEDEFLGLWRDWEEANSELTSALAACKGPRKMVKDAKEAVTKRMPWKAFERAIEDRLKPGAERQREDTLYRQAMAWFGRPLVQTAFDFETSRAAGVAQLHSIDLEGFEAGKNGHNEDANTWSPGTEQFSRWHTAYVRGREEFMKGQKEIAEKMGPAPAAAAGTTTRRGRPRRDGLPNVAGGRRGRRANGAEQQKL